MGYGTEDAFARMIGRTLASVALSSNKAQIVITFTDGARQTFGVEGDCCSSSWIEHLEAPNDVNGATVLAIEDGGSVDATNDDKLNPKRPPMYDGDDNNREHECLLVYSTTFRTTRGDIVLEYRNSSNGYYGGSLTDDGWESASKATTGADGEVRT